MFIIHRIVFLLNLLAIVALLTAYLSPFLSPLLFWPAAFAGLAYPFILLLNVLFIIYWIVFLRIRFVFSLATIVIGWSFLDSYFQFKPKKDKDDEKGIKIASFNSRYMGFELKKEDMNSMYEYLNEEKPDILCIQEFYSRGVEKGSFYKRITDGIGLKHSKLFMVNNPIEKYHISGYLIASKYPIIAKGEIVYKETSYNHSYYADLKIDGDTVRLINVHLQSISFKPDDYHFIEKKSLEKDSGFIYTKNIARKLKYAFQKRAKQAEQIRDFIEGTTHPIILCGDFNDPPISYAYRAVSHDLKDAFAESGGGMGSTYVGPFPSFRIDYILYEKEFKSKLFKSKEFKFSDHKMVQTELVLK